MLEITPEVLEKRDPLLDDGDTESTEICSYRWIEHRSVLCFASSCEKEGQRSPTQSPRFTSKRQTITDCRKSLGQDSPPSQMREVVARTQRQYAAYN